ncbi:MAG: sorbosone dehydrogenase family protein [Actinomycetota bacterium]
MRRFLIVPILLVLMVPASPAHAQTYGAQLVKGGLDFPAAFALTPAGKIVYAERFTGEIRVYDPSTGSDTLFFRVTNLSTQGEQGLLGVTVDPQLTSGKPFVYAYATRTTPSLQNQILRIRIRPGQSPTATVIFASNTAPGQYHDGGRILFGPDGKLYAVIGESHSAANAQDLTSTAGKIVRMNRNGTVPADNPIAGNYLYSFGHRNSFGLAFDPESGDLWETENGPSCNDELNRIDPGENYAWGPNQTCSGTAPENTNRDGPQPRIMPLYWYTPTTAPTGVAFCASSGCGVTGAAGKLLFGEFNTGRIRQVTLTTDRLGVTSQSVVYDGSKGILSMERGPNGSLYFSVDDAIYRLV